MMELFIKLFISFLILFFGFKALHWTWTSQIDPKATIHKYIKKDPSFSGIVVTRDPNKLYQDGDAVAEITGDVRQTSNGILFEQLANVTVDTSRIIEYQRNKYRIKEIGAIIGTKVDVSPSGSRTLKNVFEEVLCEKIN